MQCGEEFCYVCGVSYTRDPGARHAKPGCACAIWDEAMLLREEERRNVQPAPVPAPQPAPVPAVAPFLVQRVPPPAQAYRQDHDDDGWTDDDDDDWHQEQVQQDDPLEQLQPVPLTPAERRWAGGGFQASLKIENLTVSVLPWLKGCGIASMLLVDGCNARVGKSSHLPAALAICQLSLCLSWQSRSQAG